MDQLRYENIYTVPWLFIKIFENSDIKNMQVKSNKWMDTEVQKS